MLVLLNSYVGFSVVTADQFNALFSIPCITKTTTNFACKPEFEENAALVLMVLQLHSLALFLSFCHSCEILLFSRLRAALAFSLHLLPPCQKCKQNFKWASFPLFSTLVHNDVTYCFIAHIPAPVKLIVVHNALLLEKVWSMSATNCFIKLFFWTGDAVPCILRSSIKMERRIGRSQKNGPQAAAGPSSAWIPTIACLLPQSLKICACSGGGGSPCPTVPSVGTFHPVWAGGNSWPETASAFLSLSKPSILLLLGS